MNSQNQIKHSRRDLHFLNADGMVACNPRDREAAHRVENEGIATEDINAVTCKKCWRAYRKMKDRKSSLDGYSDD